MPRYSIIQMVKVKDKKRSLKAAREKQRVIYKEIPIKLSADFSAEILQARKEWHNIFKVLKGKNLQPRILYPARLSFRIEGEIKKLLRKAKTKRIHQYKTYPKRNIKGSSLSEKEKAITRSKYL